MKMSVCDVHMAQGELARVRWNLTLRKGFEKIKVQVCAEHEKAVKSYQQGLEILSDAQARYVQGV